MHKDEKQWKLWAKEALKIEIDGILAIGETIDEDFCKVIELLLKCKGRIITTAVGKSGHVARKFAASLTSTGSPAFFLHSNEASHGDLGIITDQDIVVAFSYSGETAELKDTITYCHRFNITLIAVTGNNTSTLAQNSTIALVLPAVPEASPVMAPTTSTLMMMALGDCIAVTLHQAKGFTKKHFVIFHPGGKLGSALIQVNDVMRTGKDVPLVYSDTPITETLVEMSSKRLGSTGVLDHNQHLLGIITDGDLRRNMNKDVFNKAAVDIMTRNPVTVNIKDNILLVDALAIMELKKITAIFVCDDNKKVKGIIHIHDCLTKGVA